MSHLFSRTYTNPEVSSGVVARRALYRLANARRRIAVVSLALFSLATPAAHADAKSRKRVPAGGRAAVVVDERLSALRDEPSLSGALARRLGRGRVVALTGARREADGVIFYQAAVTRRTRGWLQSESFAAPSRAGDDARLLSLIRSSRGFDRVERARVFVDLFPRSGLRPQVLLLYGEAAEEAAAQLSRAASNRLAEDRLPADAAPLRSYYLNFNGLDRFRRQGVAFTFDDASRQFHYDGAAWREIARRYPRSSEAAEARRRLDALSSGSARK